MNSKLLYPKSQIWKKNRMEKENCNNIHIRKEITDCKCEWHRNPRVKNADLGSAIILKLSWKTYTAKDYNGFNPFSFFTRHIYSILYFPNRPLGIKIGYNKTSSNSLLCGISDPACMKQPDSEMWNVGQKIHKNIPYSHLVDDDCTDPSERNDCSGERATLGKYFVHCHFYCYWCGGSLTDPYWWMILHVSELGRGVIAVS